MEDDDGVEVVDVADPVTIGFALGGGTSGFTDETMRDTTNAGGNWTARLILADPIRPLAFEASYIGSAQTIDSLGLDSDALLVGHGAQGVIRVGAALDYPISPFAFGGIAWRHYSIENTDRNTSAVSDTDDVGEVPIGIGGQTGGFTYDLRGEYRYAFAADMVPSLATTGSDADMHRWGVSLSLGYSM